MQQFRRNLAALAVAATLPTIVLSAAQVTLTLTEQRRETERVLIERARRLTLIVDGRIEADVSGLRALCTAPLLADGRFRDFTARARTAFTIEPGWTLLRVSDARTGATLAAIHADPNAAPDPSLAAPAAAGAPTDIAIALSADGRTLFVTVPAPQEAGPPRYLVTLGVDGAIFQDVLLQNVNPGEVAALVMRGGRFLARSANYDAQKGQPASPSLRKAISGPRRQKGPLIEIAVSDTGGGMSTDIRERALEPFFTTKPPGQGTGLGLAQVFSLARRSKGEVELESAPGAGTRVQIRLPRA